MEKQLEMTILLHEAGRARVAQWVKRWSVDLAVQSSIPEGRNLFNRNIFVVVA